MPTVKIIIPAYQAAGTLPAVLDAAVPQAAAMGATVCVVDSTGDDTAEVVRRGWPVEVLALSERTLPGPARNLGATGTEDLLVFLDADAIPRPGWLSALVDHLGPGDVAVAGAIANGTPRSTIGTAGWLLEFSNWLPGADSPHVDHAASASLLVRRPVFESAGGFPEEVWPGEDTILTRPWGEGRLAFAPDAVVEHQNRTTIRDFLRHQVRLGAAFVQVCRQTPFEHAVFARRPWALGGGALRVAALARRLRRRPDERRQAIRTAPAIAAGLVAWTLGVWRAAGRPM
jgi:glycosyltransferase involved in cell wall biosynthesis